MSNTILCLANQNNHVLKHPSQPQARGRRFRKGVVIQSFNLSSSAYLMIPTVHGLW